MTIMELTHRIAKVKSTFFGIEDHGILTFILDLDYGGSGQGFGNFFLTKGRIDGFELIQRVLSAAGVRQWEDLRGRTVLALSHNGMVRGLAPLPTEPGKGFIVTVDGEIQDWMHALDAP